MELLKIDDLSIYYITQEGETQAVNNLNLKIGKGETLGFVGETGAGKTTTALGIMRLVPDPPGKIMGGKIFFDGENLLEKTEKEMTAIRGNKISMIFQDPMTSLNPVMTVGEQIKEVLQLHQDLKKEELDGKAAEMLELVGIKRERFKDYPHQFSGGMKQRVVIAMALACNPQLIIADEPTTALDVTIQAQVLELMIDLKKKFNTSMIMITHDLGIVAEICDNVAIMYAGSVIEYGSVKDIYTDPKHPYTIGLFNSIPKLDDDDEMLHVIKGMPPNPVDLPSGCRFHPRCNSAQERCKNECPAMYNIDGEHSVACFLFEKQNSNANEFTNEAKTGGAE